MGIVTVLVSFGIGIFVHYLGEGREKSNNLDLHIALDYVWLFKYFLGILALSLLIPLLLSINIVIIRVIIFILWAITLVALFWLVVRLYNWVKGDKDNFKLAYLRDFPKSPRDQIMAWQDYWATNPSINSRFKEKDFFIVFAQQINLILNEKEDWELLPKLLETFGSNIQNRNKIFILIFKEFFPEILEWHLLLWRKTYIRFTKNHNTSDQVNERSIFEAEHLIDQIIKYITNEALLGKTGNSFSYFEFLKNHVDKYENEKIVGEQHIYTYIDSLPIYYDILNKIPSSQEAFDIWNHYFPETWKINLQNIENHLIARMWWKIFIEWARERIWSGKKGWDQDLEEISRELFPTVDPMIWAKILTLILRPWSGSRIKMAVESEQNFGMIGRVITGWVNDNNEDNLSDIYTFQKRETLKLALRLFNAILTKENIAIWLDELNNLSYDQNSDHDQQKEAWIDILRALEIERKSVDKN